jgi:uncharacterized membrane protein
MENANIETPQRAAASDIAGRTRTARFVRNRPKWRASIPYIYVGVALPTTFLLCFLIPPIQSPDEGRHFLRAYQIAQGQMLSQIDPNTHQAGGWIPAAASGFVRDKMRPDYLRNEDRLRTLGERLSALDQAAQSQSPLSEKVFASFPGATIYPPPLYLPQVAGISLARLFSNKVYVWFYAARCFNALAAVLLVFFGLRLAPGHRLALIIPAILPISLYQMSSASSDAAIIALSVLFVALCLRFVQSDGAAIRIALIVCLVALTTNKPVHLAFVVLLLAAYQRLGWRRAILFFSTACVVAVSTYIGWAYLVRQFLPLAGTGFPNHNPYVQIHFLVAHPLALVPIVRNTLIWDGRRLISEVIGFFGWGELPLPPWFYKAGYALLAAVLLIAVVNYKPMHRSRILLGSVAAAGVVASVSLASFIMWTPVGEMKIWGLQGRYFVPAVAMLAFLVPASTRLGGLSNTALAVSTLGFFALSTVTTVRIVNHYYFSDAQLIGRNIHELFIETSGRACPATLEAAWSHGVAWFSTIADGWADVDRQFRIVITDENGTIVAESDPALAGADFPYVLLPGSSHSRWRARIWTPSQIATLHYWLITGKNACMFGPDLKLTPYPIPNA